MRSAGKHRFTPAGRRWGAAAAAVGLAAGAVVAVGGTDAVAVSGSAAAFTSIAPTVDTGVQCGNGPADPVNCNSYDSKDHVWLNGGPIGSKLGAGDYFFAVVAPGGKADPNDGAPKLLSTDAYGNRTFHVDGNGDVTYSGTHDFVSDPTSADYGKIRLAPFADTPNAGGVYGMAICSLAGGYPVASADCKYDAFKVNGSTPTPDAAPLTVSKDAAGAYTDTYAWGVSKSVDKTVVKQVGGSATFTYTVSVSHDSGTVSGVTVSGTISVTNPNAPLAVDGVDVSDTLSDGTACTVTGGSDVLLTGFTTTFPYTCALTGLPAGQLDNTVTATWPNQSLSDGSFLPGDTATFTFDNVSFAATNVDACANVTDTVAGTLGTLCAGDTSPTNYTYSRTVPVPAFNCVGYGNTATFTTNTTGTTGSASQSVQVCGPARTGALTIGFWQNKNGQAIITGQAKTGTCASAGWLRQYAPFQDLAATATCSAVATYVGNVVKAANASGATMNAMLKAQLLATALDTYFSDPALGGNRIAAPIPLGGVAIDLTKVCKNIGTCSVYENTGAAFNGATALTVNQLLAYAASQSNTAGSMWYSQVKSTQELAKDTFDAINNQVAFSA